MVLVLFSSCGVVKMIASIGQKKKESQSQAVSVVAAAAKKGSLSRYLDLSGQLSARNEVKVYADVPGKISRIDYFEGSFVRKDAPLAYIDRSQVGATYALAPVRAPLSGYVTSVYVTLGQNVAAGTVPIASVGDIFQMDLLLNIPESSVDQVRVGQTVSLKVPAFPGRTFTGQLYRKDYNVDPLSHTLLARVRVNNPKGELLPGMYADASVLLQSASGVVVLPSTALFDTPEGGKAVYVNVSNVARLRPVKLLFSYRDKAAVQSGVLPGEDVVVFGREFIKDGTAIYAIREEEGGAQ